MCCHYLLENRFVLICQQSRIITIIPATHIQIDIFRPSVIAIVVDVLVHLYALQVFSSYIQMCYCVRHFVPFIHTQRKTSQQKYRCYSCRYSVIVSRFSQGMMFRYTVPFAVLANITNNAFVALLNQCSKSIQPTNS